MKALLLAAAIGVATLFATPAANAETATAATLSRFAEMGIDVEHLPPGWQVVGDEIQWRQETDMGILTTAVAGYGPCRSGYFCMFQHANFGGAMWYSNDRSRYHVLSQYSFNDVTSSWQNNTIYDARWYFDYPHTGRTTVCVQGGDEEDVPSTDPVVLNDQASAVYIYPNQTACPF
jgi:hypothetical protein